MILTYTNLAVVLLRFSPTQSGKTMLSLCLGGKDTIIIRPHTVCYGTHTVHTPKITVPVILGESLSHTHVENQMHTCYSLMSVCLVDVTELHKSSVVV